MKLQEVLDLIQIKFPNIAISKNQAAIINFINLGMSELYKTFNLKIKSETVVTTSDLALYELKNDDVELILAVFDKFGNEFRQSDVLQSLDYEYKLVNFRSFLLRKPFEGILYVVYKAAPVRLVDIDDEIDIPSCMLDALLTYISYALVSTINSDQKNDSGYYYKLFHAQCQELVNQGYKIPLNTETFSIQMKGFI